MYLGRHIYGLAAVAFGVIALVWHDFGGPWQQIRALGNVPHREILVYIAAAVDLFGGIAIQWRRTVRAGAIALGSIFFAFALLWVPRIIAEPRVYDRYGNFFEQFSLVSGALIAYASTSRSDLQQATRLERPGSGTYFSVSVLFLSPWNTYFIFPEWQSLLQSGFRRDRCSGR